MHYRKIIETIVRRAAKPLIHVLPLNDLLGHFGTEDCWCIPEVEREGDSRIVIHNSFDGRELQEQSEINH